MMLRLWVLRLGLLGLSLIIGLFLLELGVRLLMPQQLVLFEPGIWIPDETGLGHRLAPNVDARINTGEREVRILTDEDGFRVGERSPRGAERTVLALGDSFLEAFAVEHGDSIAGQLETRLEAAWGQSTRVLNTGVSGYDPNHYRIRARRVLDRRPIDAVVVFLFLGNDIIAKRLESQPPRASRLKRDLGWPTSLDWRDWMDQVIHPIYTWLRTSSHLVVLLKTQLLDLLISLGFSDSAFPPLLVRDHVESPRFTVTAGIAREIADLAHQHDTPVLYVLLPADYQVDRVLGRAFASGSGLDLAKIDLDQSRRRMREELEAHGLQVLDPLPLLRAGLEAGEAPYGRVDRHLSPSGQARVALAVAGRLVEELPDKPRAADAARRQSHP